MKAQSVQSDHNVLKVTQYLGYLGLIPFVVPFGSMCESVLSEAGIHSAAIWGLYAPYIFITYSAIILSFLSGILWSKSRRSSAAVRSSFSLIFSNIIAVLAWITLLMINLSPLMMLFAVTLLLCGYASLLLAERAIDSGVEEAPYWQMRLLLTTLVIVMHSVTLILLIGDL